MAAEKGLPTKAGVNPLDKAFDDEDPTQGKVTPSKGSGSTSGTKGKAKTKLISDPSPDDV